MDLRRSIVAPIRYVDEYQREDEGRIARRSVSQGRRRSSNVQRQPGRASVNQGRRPSVRGRASTARTRPSGANRRSTLGVLLPTQIHKPGSVYTFGSNFGEQLGHSEGDDSPYPRPVPGIANMQFVGVACGDMHTVALDTRGTVWTFGNNDESQLGREIAENEENEDPDPATVVIPGKVIQISAGQCHTAALTEEGEVYVWGLFKDHNGPFGLVPYEGKNGHLNPYHLTERVAVRIVKISSGHNHLVMLGKNGFVYTCGCNDHGQLGRELPNNKTRSMAADAERRNKDFLLNPSPVGMSNRKVIDVWTGENTTFCKAKTDEMFACGLNGNEQLGIPISKNIRGCISKMEKSETLSAIAVTKMAGGRFHSVLLDNLGRVLVVGSNFDGNFGNGGQTDVSFNQPQLVQALADEVCTEISAGPMASYAITRQGRLYGWGNGINGVLAAGDDDDVITSPFLCLMDAETPINYRVVSLAARELHVALTMVGA